VTCFRVLAAHADYVAVNVSSPNTEGLRLLQDAQQLEPILASLQEERSASHSDRRPVPLLVKISPDLAERELDDLCDVVQRMGVDGVIATNTTLSRPEDANLSALAERGGLSGRPLLACSVPVIRRLRRRLGASFVIVGAGGVSCAADALAMIEAGAHLVQVYTGLVYRGPGLVREIGEALKQQDGVTGA
jgi:dihydroorotate dehydrogenase